MRISLSLAAALAVGVAQWASPAQANDLGDAVGWLNEQGVEVGVEAGPASDHSAMAMLGSRTVDGRELGEYRCEDAPFYDFAVLRTNGNQGRAMQRCFELRFRQAHVAGFVEMGPPPLRTAELRQALNRAENETGIHGPLLETIARFVSGLRPGLVSEAGHVGLLQLKPEVLAAEGIPHGDLLDPEQNILAGARFLRKMTYRFGLKTGIAAFRDGPAPVEAAGGHIPQGKRHRWFVGAVFKIYKANHAYRFPTDIGAESMAFVFEWLE